jgi:hypothetical protein
VLVHLHRQDAHHVLVEPHQALHLRHGRGGRVRAEEGVVALPVLVDLVGHRLDAPVLVLDDLAAVVGQHGAEMLDQRLGLRVGQVLTGDEHMLVERHVHS